MESQYIDVSDLLNLAADYKIKGYRLIQMCCVPGEGEGHDLLYSFALPNSFADVQIKVPVPEDRTVPSIAAFYPPVFMYENETHDLFGVTFTGMAVDYHGYFIATEEPFPMRGMKGRGEGK